MKSKQKNTFKTDLLIAGKNVSQDNIFNLYSLKILIINNVCPVSSFSPDVREFLQLDNPRNTSINLDEDDVEPSVESVVSKTM